jgi:catechol 2,3-dioxygenase-like lactoylglutathione lyase family enzyme
MPLEIESCNHVSVQTKQLDESRKFYVEVLGAQEISRPNFSFGGAWLYLAGMQIHLIEQGSPAGRTEIDTRGNHVAFQVRDVDEAERRLQAFGIAYKRKLIEDRGIHQIFFQDPDGHTIEVGRYGIINQ